MDSLVERARGGDRIAMEELLASVAPSIQRFGMRMCKATHDADDVLQDTLLAVAQHLPEFEGRSSFTSWVFALTRSACARRRRGLKNAPPVSDERMIEQPDAAPSPEARAEGNQLARVVEQALAGLSEDYREVILLRDVEGLSAPEAAAAIGISVDALKSRLHRAREALRTSLRPVLEDSAPPSASCPDVATLWSRMLEGELSQDDCAAMEKHMQGCAACAGACDALKRALVACRRVATTDVPPEVQARVKAAVRAFFDAKSAVPRE